MNTSSESKTEQLPSAIPARLPFNPKLGQDFGISDVQWKALVESVFPNVTSANSIALALSYCKTRGFDIMKKPVHIVPIWDSNAKRMVDTVWPSLNLFRTEAARTGAYAGIDPAEFGPTIEEEFSGTTKVDGKNVKKKITLRYPEWCRITVYRMVQGQRVAFPSPRVMWREYYATAGRFNELPNEQWARRPSYMVEKVTESLALRRAFPEECDSPTAEEMTAAALDSANSTMRDVSPQQTSWGQAAQDAREAAEPADTAPEATTDGIEDAELVPDDKEPAQPVVAAGEEQAGTAGSTDAPNIPPGRADDASGANNAHWTDSISVEEGFPGSDEWTEGKEAFAQSAPATDCPYEGDKQKAADWLGGWFGAQKAAE